MPSRSKSNLNLCRLKVRIAREKRKRHITFTPKSPCHKRKTFSTPMKSPGNRISPAKKKFKINSARKLFQNSDNSEKDCLVTLAEMESNFEIIHNTGQCETDFDSKHKQAIFDNNVQSLHKPQEESGKDTNIDKDENSKYEEEMIRLVPEVMKILRRERGLDVVIMNFFRQIKEEKFPLNNIAFLLWTEVIKWYDSPTTASMRYSDETKLFWKLGWRLFGGRFLYYMGGYKNTGDITLNDTLHGLQEPSNSEINFAVPDQKTLKKHVPYFDIGERKPGIYDDVMKAISTTLKDKSSCLTFDGKKLKQGLTDLSGDVDLLGFEENENINEKRLKLQEELEERRVLYDQLESLQMNEANVKQIPNSYKENIGKCLLHDLQRVSENIFVAREIRRRKEYCKAKLIERGGNTDWKKGKYVYAISAITAFIYEIDEFVEKAVCLTELISRYISYFHGSLFVTGKTLNLQDSTKYVSICPDMKNDDKKETRHIKQHSEEWFSLRKRSKVSGSTIYAAIGCDGMNNMKNHFDKVICGLPEKEHSEQVKAAMEHGSKNEVNAVATIVGKIIPVLYPRLIFCEEGCVATKSDHQDPFMVVSPDGSLRADVSLSSTVTAVEIKCPVRKIHTEFPCRYLLQCLLEIESLQVESLLFASWTEHETVVFTVPRDVELFRSAQDIALSLYDEEKPKKPTKLNEAQKKIKEKIVEKCKDIRAIGRFNSLRIGSDETTYDQSTVKIGNLLQLLENTNESAMSFFELNRQRATEAVVFLVADLDRSWEKDSARASPVGWFPKGYSLSTDLMRRIAEDVHTRCHNYGIHLPCQSFDGQWHRLVVRSIDDKPLTVFQLQKDVWKDVESLKKTDIMQKVKQMNKNFSYKVVLKTEECINGTPVRVLHLTNGGLRLPKYRHLDKQTVNKKVPIHETDDEPTTTLADVVPEIVQFSSEINNSLLALEPVDGKDEMEALNVNVDAVNWARELEDMQHEEESNTPEYISDTRTGTDVVEEFDERNDASLSMNSDDATIILSLLKSSKQCNKLSKWESITACEFLTNFSSQDHLKKLLDVELRIIVRYLKKTKHIKMTVKESSSKHAKLKELCHLLGLEFKDASAQRKARVKKVKTLAELAGNTLSKKVSKQELNVLYAEYIWPERYRNWKESSAVRNSPTLDGNDYNWFYTPEYSSTRQQLEVRCIDSTHLLTRTRRMSCKGGLDGKSNEAWIKVAKSRKTLLTPTMVEDVTDPMSVSMATTHFSQHVETTMRSYGYKESADLCQDIRQWWESEDKPGIPACDRVRMRHNLRERLLKHADFSHFPPPTMYIKGWHVQLWEALLASIDAKALLYGLCHSGKYNVRAFSSMIGETFFSELTLNDKRGQGTVTSQEFGQFVGNTMEQIQARLDPERSFCYRTSRKTVYKLLDNSDTIEDTPGETCRICEEDSKSLPSNIVPSNHNFDEPARCRIKGRKKEATVPVERNAIQRGSLGVRWERARRNDAKLLPTKRLGIHED